jgi:hypothetical protein
MVEVCPWFTPEDRAAASAAVDAVFRNDPTPSVSAVGNTPAEPNAGYTLEDIRDLLRYKRELAAFEQRRQALARPAMSLTDAWTHTQWCAINCPQPGRLKEKRATSLPVYRRLVKAARKDYHADLDESTLGMLVADVSERAGTDMEALMRMPLDDFGRLWDQGSSAGQRQIRRKRSVGRPSDTDHTLDRRVCEAWDTERYTTFADLAREFNLPNARAAELAVGRHRKRIERARKKAAENG